MIIFKAEKYLVLFIMLAAAVYSSGCPAGSIYAKRTRATAKPIYSDDKAHRVGDLLTIIIAETSSIDTEVDRVTSKETDHSLTVKAGDNAINGVSFLPNMGVSTESLKGSTGKHDYEDERTFTDKITVVVEDVLSNGNLVVIGTRERDVSGDKQIIQVSGIVRPRDISFANTIRSEQVANFKLVNLNEGISEDYNSRGWLSEFLDSIWPF